MQANPVFNRAQIIAQGNGPAGLDGAENYLFARQGFLLYGVAHIDSSSPAIVN